MGQAQGIRPARRTRLKHLSRLARRTRPKRLSRLARLSQRLFRQPCLTRKRLRVIQLKVEKAVLSKQDGFFVESRALLKIKHISLT